MRKVLLIICILLAVSIRPEAQVTHTCGMQMNDDDVVFCDRFDTAYPDSTTRTGDLDEDVWGVSRTKGSNPNYWMESHVGGCDNASTVFPPDDVRICNGRLINTLNDAGDVVVLAMYPKQPFDWAGREGTVSFDVVNDSQGFHAAWPEFWITDLPIPAPFSHFGNWRSNPRHGFGIRLEMVAGPGVIGLCPFEAPTPQTWRWTIGGATVIRDWVFEDTEALDFGSTPSDPPLTVTLNDCVVSDSPHEPEGDPFGPMNHVEVRIIDQDTIEVWASDAGETTLTKIGTITNAGLTLTRGLIWIEDAHYNASKGVCHQHGFGDPEINPELPECQTDHAFGWDNVAFDGPFVYRDFSYDAVDNDVAGPPFNYHGVDIPTMQLAKTQVVGEAATSWNILNMPANPQAAVVRLMFNIFTVFDVPTELYATVNGHAHTQAWPYPDTATNTWRTTAITIPITDLVTGTNVVTLASNTATGYMHFANVNIVLVNVPGGVPVLPGSDNSYPVEDDWVNITGNLAGMSSECGNLTSVSGIPGSNDVIAGVALGGLWKNSTGSTWTALGTSGDAITNRPLTYVYKPGNNSIFYEAGIGEGQGTTRGGAYKTSNSGASFTQLGTIKHLDSISVDFSDEQTIIAGGHEQQQTVWKSTNGGGSFTNVGANIPSGYKFTSNVLLLNSTTYLVNAQGYTADNEGIFRTTNGGTTWTLVHNQGPEWNPLVASDGTIYWPYGNSLLKSVDNGANWTQVGSGAVLSFTPIELSNGDLVSVGGSTLVKSVDGGVNWTSYGPDLPFTPKSITYSTGRHMYVISQWDCNGVVLDDAIEAWTAEEEEPGTSFTVCASGCDYSNLQTAIDAASLGDELVLTAGETFTGSFTLPLKTGSSYLTIRSSATLPNRRILDTDVGLLAKITTSTSGSTFLTATGGAGPHHYKLQGLEITTSTDTTNDLIAIGTSGTLQDDISEVPSYFIINKCFIHGVGSGDGTKRGIAANGAYVDVTNSWIDDIYQTGQDANAIMGWNGPGPFNIINNRLEAASENVMFGGSDPSITNLIPSDILVSRNYMTKPIAWLTGLQWDVKNIFELKNARRVTITYNIFEHNWPDAQPGSSLLITPRNQDGGCNWCDVDDVEFAFNVLRHASSGFNILGTDDGFTSGVASNISIHDNLLYDINPATYGGGSGRFVQIAAGAVDVIVNHNTAIVSGDSIVYASEGDPMVNFIYTNNLTPWGLYGIMGSGTSPGNGTIATYFPSSTITKNVFYGPDQSVVGSGNFQAADSAAIAFTNFIGLVFSLDASSPYKNAGTDGRDLGADIGQLNQYLYGVEEGSLMGEIKYRFRIRG